MEQRTDKLQLPDKGRKEWVDFGKGISMFLVVLFHSEVYYPITWNWRHGLRHLSASPGRC